MTKTNTKSVQKKRKYLSQNGYITGLKRLQKNSKLYLANIAGFPKVGVVRVMPENQLYTYSGITPLRLKSLKPIVKKQHDQN